MIALDCACGRHIEAPEEEGVVLEVRKHVDLDHASAGFTDDQIRELVATKKYTVD